MQRSWCVCKVVFWWSNLSLEISIYLFSNFRFILLCIIIRKSVIYLMCKSGLQLIHFDGCFRVSCPILHPYHLHYIHELLTPHFLKFILIILGTGKNREWKCKQICLPALKFCIEKEFFQDELGWKDKLGQNFAKNLVKIRVIF